MMMVWKAVVFLSGFVASASYESETHLIPTDDVDEHSALLQRHVMKSHFIAASSLPLHGLSDSDMRKQSLAQLRDHFMAIAKSQAQVTPEVAQMSEEISQMLSSTVMPAILEEHDTDQHSLNAAYAEFPEIEARRLAWADQISNMDTEMQAALVAHRECRTVQTEHCVENEVCESEVTQREEICHEIEERLRRIEEEIHTPYCVEHADRAVMEFRREMVVVFEEYTSTLVELEGCVALVEEISHNCSNSTQTWRNQSTVCDSWQRTLEEEACEYLIDTSSFLIDYMQLYTDQVTHCEWLSITVQKKQDDRIVEWTTLEQAMCLLDALVHDMDGDTASEVNVARIDACMVLEVDTSHLLIDFPQAPGPGDLPSPPISPCSDDFASIHYSELPVCGTHGNGVMEEDCICDEEALLERVDEAAAQESTAQASAHETAP